MATEVISWVLTAKDATSAAFGSVESKLARLGVTTKGASASGVAMGAGFIVGGALIAKGLGSAVGEALKFDDAFAIMNRQIGNTGAAADKWDASFRKVYAAGPAATLENTAAVLGVVGQKLQGAQPDLEKFAVGMFKLARIQGEEVVPLTTAAAQAFNNWGIEVANAGPKLDFLTVVSQKSGISLTDLFSTLTKMGPALREGNISFEQGAAILGMFGKAGIDVGRAQQGLQKALVTTAKAMQDGKIQAKDLGDGLNQQFLAIKNSTSAQEGLALSAQLFGTRSAPIFYDAIKRGAFSLDDLTKAFGNTGGALDKTIAGNTTLEGRMAAMKRQVDLAKEAIGRGLTPVLEAILPPIAAFVGAIGTFLTKNPEIAKMIGIFAALLAVLLTFVGIVKIFQAVGASFEVLGAIFEFNPIVLAITAIAVAAFLIYKNWGTIQKWLEDFWNWFMGIISTVVDWVKSNWQLIAIAITGPIGIAVALVIKYWDQITGAISTAVDFVGGLLSGAWSGIAGFVGGIWDGVVSAIEDAFSPVVDWINQQLDIISGWWDVHGKQIIAIVKFIWDFIVGWFTTEFEIVKTIVTTGWDAIVAVFTAVWGLIAPIIQAGWDAIVAIWDAGFAVMSAAWDAFWGVITAVVTAGWDLVKAAFTAGFAIISGVVSAGWSVLTSIWDVGFGIIKLVVTNAWAVITGAFNVARDLILGIVGTFLDLITGNWGQAWTDIKDTVTNVLSDIWNVITSVFGNITGFLQTAWDAIKNIWNTALNLVQTITSAFFGFLEAAWNAFWNLVTSIIDVAWTAIKAIWNAAVAFVSAIMTAWWAALTAAWNAFWTVVSTLISGAWDAIKAVWNAAVAFVTGVMNAFFGAIQAAWNAFWSTVEGIISGAWGWIQGAFNAAVGAVTGIMNSLWSTIVGIWNTIWQTISSIVGGIWDTVVGTFNKIVGFIGNLASSFYNAALNLGKSIINGIVDFIVNSAGRITSAIGGIINKIPGAGIIKDVLGLSEGGLVDFPTSGAFALLHGREAVLPLNNPKRMMEILNSSAVQGALAGSVRRAPTGSPAASGAISGALATIHQTGSDHSAELVAVLKDIASKPRVIDVDIHNPSPEPAGPSIQRRMHTLSNFGIFDS